jgi:hypothetical protein
MKQHLVSLLGLLVAACSAGGAASTTSNDGGSGGSGAAGATGAGANPSASGGGGSSGVFMGTGGSGASQPGCDAAPDEDKDQDGFTITAGDCNDCDANVNPAAIEVVGDEGEGGSGGYVPADEDCDGNVDNPPLPCDDGLPVNASDPLDGARAIELCKIAEGPQDWGVVSAQWVRANGTTTILEPAQYGIMPGFGPNVPARAGSNLLGLSSGRARLPSQPDFCGSQTCDNGSFTPGVAPPGFPLLVCNADSEINDDIGLELQLRAPTNATGYQFDFRFYSFEFAEWVCTSYNDQFIALMTPAPMNAPNGNISFDMNNNPVSVNLGFFDTCDTCDDWADLCFNNCPPQPNPCCPAGNAALQGTGFEFDAGATAWLQTTAPVEGGATFSLRFAIWDAGDSALDSTTILDNFQWIANGGTVNVGTTPIPQ